MGVSVSLAALASTALAASHTITIESPREGDVLTARTLVVSGTSTNAARVQVCILGVECQNATTLPNWSVSFDLRPLPEGTYTVEACAFDSRNVAVCAPRILLQLSRIELRIATTLEQYALPSLAGVGVLASIAVLAVPRLHRVANGIGSLLGGVALSAVAVRLYASEFSLPIALAGVLIIALMAVHHWARPREGV